MSVTECDLELLENYLDDELSADEADGLRRRLSSEPQLASAIDELRAQRELRSQFFASVEPDSQTTEQLIRSVRKSMNRQIVWSHRAGLLRQIGSLAACLLVGIIGGYGLRGSLPNAPIQHIAPISPPIGGIQTPVVFRGAAGGYQVNVFDKFGNVIETWRFATLEAAQQYIDSIRNLQGQNQQIQDGSKGMSEQF